MEKRYPEQRHPFMATSRRLLLTGLFGATATACLGQGVVTAQSLNSSPRQTVGLPFNFTFTDVAAKAGLGAVTVYGESDRKEYIVETLGCGCAFLDFDNDGWLEIFCSPELATPMLPLAPAIGSSNNRDGTFTDVTERAGLLKPAGPAAFAWATITMTDSTTCSSPTGARTSSTATMATELLQT